MYSEFFKNILRDNLISEGDKIVVGVSGGPDSVCLLHLLSRLREDMNIQIYAVHLNHQLRGLDAHMDALYTMNLCDRLNITCLIRSIDVEGFCIEHKYSIEDGARRLRYHIFDEVKNRVGADKIAVGHNKNDQAETVIMRLMRGSSMNGLRGIDKKREDGIIRPILDFKREEIEDYCKRHNLSPKIDATNLEAIYTRNKIRLKLIPYMKEEFNKNVVDNIVRLSDSLRVDCDFIDSIVKKALLDTTKVLPDRVYIYTSHLKKYHEAISTRVVMESIRNLIGDTNQIEKVHIDDIISLIPDEKKNRKLDIPRGIKAFRTSNYIMLTTGEIKDSDIEYEMGVRPESRQYIAEIDKCLITSIKDIDEYDKNSIDEGIQYIDIGKIKGKLVIRNRRPGDKIKLSGGTKKVKQLFMDLKIPKEDRNKIPLLVDSEEVVAVVGLRINEKYRVDAFTKKVLSIEIE